MANGKNYHPAPNPTARFNYHSLSLELRDLCLYLLPQPSGPACSGMCTESHRCLHGALPSHCRTPVSIKKKYMGKRFCVNFDNPPPTTTISEGRELNLPPSWLGQWWISPLDSTGNAAGIAPPSRTVLDWLYLQANAEHWNGSVYLRNNIVIRLIY